MRCPIWHLRGATYKAAFAPMAAASSSEAANVYIHFNLLICVWLCACVFLRHGSKVATETKGHNSSHLVLAVEVAFQV
jgi:hypothetical protein